MQFQNLLNYLSYPFRAAVSRNFYFGVMFKMKGAGLLYLLLFCCALALPAVSQVKDVLNKFKSLELATVVAQIPASNISTMGVLTPVDPNNTKPFVIRNSKNEVVLAYNLENAPIEGYNGIIPITVTSHAALITSKSGNIINVPWTSIYGTSGAQFEPLYAAQMLEQAFNASYATVWVVIALWIFSSLALVVLVAACITKVLSPILVKTRITLLSSLRLSAFGASIIGFFMLAQFFINISLSYVVMCLVPAIYSLSFLFHLNRTVTHAMRDVNFALSKQNPMFEYFDVQSRIDENGQIDAGPDFFELNPEQQEQRRETLRQHIAKGQSINFANHLLYLAKIEQARQNGQGGYQQSSQSSFRSFQESERDSSSSPNQASDNRVDNPWQQTEHEEQEGNKTPNPYIFNENAGADDPIFKEHMEQAPERGQVRKGDKGEDSSFTP